MLRLCNIGHSFDYEFEKLIRLFMPFEKIETHHNIEAHTRMAVCTLQKGEKITLTSKVTLDGKTATRSKTLESTADDKLCERQLAILLFENMVELTGYKPDWGILTGVRPVRLFSHYCDLLGKTQAEEYFTDTLKVSPNKISLCSDAAFGEEKIISLSRPESFSLYLSVPFCPTRCSYCSFVSHSVDKAKDLIPEYVSLLCKELDYTASIAKSIGLRLETVYMGGGTPTTLSASQLETVLGTVNRCFDMGNVREYTVEAGRPDTITREKLLAIKKSGVGRISINPQTMNDNVLSHIGRNHTAQQMVDAFRLARELGFDNINADLIAGLPTDTMESFESTVEQILALDPESITVHSLSMKRASTLTNDGYTHELSAGTLASKMVDFARDKFTQRGIMPYYMYRQSKTVGNLENVGYAKAGFEGLYNVYIMDETHTILACGASAVTKLREPYSNGISRIFNYKYPYEYISRFDDMIDRKKAIIKFYEEHPISQHL